MQLKKISAVLLASGESKRMGRLKQLLPLGKTTIIEQAIDNLLNSAVGEVIVVLGYQSEEIKQKIARPWRVKFAINSNYRRGMSSSIAAGLRAVDAGAGAVMLALADQPFIDSGTINKVLGEFIKHDKGIAFPTYHGKRGHPVIFSMKYSAELLELEGDAGAREIIGRHRNDVLEVPVESPAVCQDIDSPRDYDACSR